MARPPYTNIPTTDVDLDSPITEDEVIKAFRDNIDATRIELVATDFTEQTTTSGSWVTLSSFPLTIPDVEDYSGIQRKLSIWLAMRTDGVELGEVRLRDLATLNVGAAKTTTSGSYEPKQPTLDIDAAWKGTTRTFQIRGQVTGGATLRVKSEKSNGGFLEY